MSTKSSREYLLELKAKLSKLKVSDLKAELQSCGLSKGGKKAQLVSRLKGFIESKIEATELRPVHPPGIRADWGQSDRSSVCSGLSKATQNAIAESNEKAARYKAEIEALKLQLEATKLKNEIDKAEATELPQHKSYSQTPSNAGSIIGTDQMLAAVKEMINISRAPIPEPPIFTGDVLEYQYWRTAFHMLVEERNIPLKERMFILGNYVSGEALKCIKGYLKLRSPDACGRAIEVLDETYGNSLVLAEAFRNKLDSWKKVENNPKAIKEFADFIMQCATGQEDIKELKFLDDYKEIKSMACTLPNWLQTRWNRLAYEYYESQRTYPRFADFSTFINKEARILSHPTSTQAKAISNTEVQSKGSGKHTSKVLTTQTSEGKPSKQETSNSCLMCEKTNHTLEYCRKLKGMAPEERSKFVYDHKLCFRCLKSGHFTKQCPKRSTCKDCGKDHPTSLHLERENKNSKTRTAAATISSTEQSTCNDSYAITHTSKISKEDSDKFSMIVPVYVSDGGQREILTYALLDSQSDTSFISDSVANSLSCHGVPTSLKLSTMTSKGTIIKCSKFQNLMIRGLSNEERVELATVYSRPSIPINRSHIPTPTKANRWKHLRNVEKYLSPLLDCDVGMLIGYDCPEALLPIEVVPGPTPKCPFGVRTSLGWSIVGSATGNQVQNDFSFTHHTVRASVPLELQVPQDDRVGHSSTFLSVSRFKELKVDPILQVLEQDFKDTQDNNNLTSQDDLAFMKIMDDGLHKNQDGYIVLPLPLKDKTHLPNNKSLAENRLESLYRKFRHNQEYKTQYEAFIQEMVIRNEAELVSDFSLDHLKNGRINYLPHHGVYHPQKRKLRVVFDCSAKFKGTSLNDQLLQGPNLTNNLVAILCRFRLGRYAFSCDIERMFYQFKVCEQDRDLLRFLWIDNNNQLVTYRMNVHIFGATSSPACSSYGLKALAKEYRSISEEASNFVEENFYVDDGLMSTDEISTAHSIIEHSRLMCATANIRLHKFTSNEPAVLENLPQTEMAQTTVQELLPMKGPTVEHALGIQWLVESDMLQTRFTQRSVPFTRRGLLSYVSAIYDPLGFVSPFILLGKQLLQRVSKTNNGWDDPLPEDVKVEWSAWCEDAPNLSKVRVNRCYQTPSLGMVMKYELHHFCDASTTGYGCCSYLRQIDNDNNISVSLVLAKSRVAPTKTQTIPRLELQSCVLAARMSKFLQESLGIPAIEHHFWTDSTAALGYITNDSKAFKMFVANRVQEIRQISSVDRWKHIAGSLNPADVTSRGSKVSTLMEGKWFSGPSFLHTLNPIPAWDQYTISSDDEELKQREKAVFVTQENAFRTFTSKFEDFSKWSALTRAIGSLIRKINKTTHLDASHIEKAIVFILKKVQEEHFSDELARLKLGKPLRKSSPMRDLDPFLDADGIIRVGGRLSNSTDLLYGQSHPRLLPKSSHVSLLLVRHFHDAIAHQGRGTTINMIRSNGYWILGCRAIVSAVVNSCVSCKRQRGNPEGQLMAPLPKERVTFAPPFSLVGIDCFGPFYVTDGRKKLKKYGLIATCFSTRGVHLEMLDSLSTDDVINGLRCIVALRGPIKQVWCDQGTNFIGARNELTNAFQEVSVDKVRRTLLENSCTFHFNVPKASHMGGAWERLIRSARNILSAMLAKINHKITSSSLRTLLYEVMAILNSRPLTTFDLEDPTGPLPLTPNHILTCKSYVSTQPPGDFAELSLRKQWRIVQHYAQTFWRRWRLEYLNTLQRRSKWGEVKQNLKVGDIVLLHDDNLCRNEWPLARIQEVHPSRSDGLIRKVKVRTADGLYDRPIHKMTLLIG